jgi:hypothetical protein
VSALREEAEEGQHPGRLLGVPGDARAPPAGGPRAAKKAAEPAKDADVDDDGEHEEETEDDGEPGAQRALFDALCTALGIDGASLIETAVERFCEGWIADVRAKVAGPSAEAAAPRRSLQDDEA